jgi:hypothetical protein
MLTSSNEAQPHRRPTQTTSDDLPMGEPYALAIPGEIAKWPSS